MITHLDIRQKIPLKMHSDLRTDLWIGGELAKVECRVVKDIVSGFYSQALMIHFDNYMDHF